MQDPAEWRLTSPGGVKFKLLRQWGSFGREDATWNMEICIRVIDLPAFLLECFPLPVVVGNYVVYARRFYPDGLPSLECKSVAVEEFTSGKPIDPFSAAPILYTPDEYAKTFEPYLKVSLTFGPSPANDQERDPEDPQTWLEVSANASGEFLASDVNQDDVEWGDIVGATEEPDEKDTPLSQTITCPQTEWTCTWPQIPFAFYQDTLVPRMREAMGKVNDGTISLFRNAPAETILFLGWQEQYEYTWREGHSGTSPVKATLRFLEKNFMGKQAPLTEEESSQSGESESSQSGESESSEVSWNDVQVTHNHIWRANHGWWRLLINDNPIYEQVDLMKIFRGDE